METAPLSSLQGKWPLTIVSSRYAGLQISKWQARVDPIPWTGNGYPCTYGGTLLSLGIQVRLAARQGIGDTGSASY